jgi:predicted phosphoribosyltransferase
MPGNSDSSRQFSDRGDAGEQLASALAARGIDADVVLAIPRGGLPVGRAVADALDAPLDVVVASKIGAPSNPELAIGAAASDGSVWLDEDLVDRLGVSQSYLARVRERETETAREQAARYRDGAAMPALDGKRVVVVDDGVATGATAKAALRLVHDAGADRVILAVPVGPPDTITDLEAEADDVVCLSTPATFGAVGRFYRQFDQVSDSEAVGYLDRTG